MKAEKELEACKAVCYLLLMALKNYLTVLKSPDTLLKHYKNYSNAGGF